MEWVLQGGTFPEEGVVDRFGFGKRFQAVKFPFFHRWVKGEGMIYIGCNWSHKVGARYNYFDGINVIAYHATPFVYVEDQDNQKLISILDNQPNCLTSYIDFEDSKFENFGEDDLQKFYNSATDPKLYSCFFKTRAELAPGQSIGKFDDDYVVLRKIEAVWFNESDLVRLVSKMTKFKFTPRCRDSIE